jgi:hypothetical protein
VKLPGIKPLSIQLLGGVPAIQLCLYLQDGLHYLLRSTMWRRLFNRLPLIGVLVGVAFIGIAATKYPGGYRWGHQTISALFAPLTTDGVENPARLLAVVGVLTIMTGMAILFYVVSSQTKSVFHKKTIQIAGIGSMVYLGLTVTPMHDLMVSIALVFFLVLMFAVLHMVYFENHFRLFLIGMVCLALQLGGAVIYYGKLFLEVLPLVQKTSLVLTVAWLLGVQFRKQGKVVTV